LGRELPPLDEQARVEQNMVRGCQSQVWLTSRNEGGRLSFDADCEAFIVKGLLAVALASYNCRTPEEILAFDLENYFSRLNLLKHLSVTRGNGLRAMVKRIRDTAQAA